MAKLLLLPSPKKARCSSLKKERREADETREREKVQPRRERMSSKFAAKISELLRY